jgi:hypothetical protein
MHTSDTPKAPPRAINPSCHIFRRVAIPCAAAVLVLGTLGNLRYQHDEHKPVSVLNAQYTGDTTISAGRLQLAAGNPNQIPYGTGSGNAVMNPRSGTATLDLNGNNQNVNGLSSSGAGSCVVEGTSGTPTLTVGHSTA